ncbi:MAG: HEAT repeat domain-containing protein [Christensenellales bacterium]
MKRVLVGFLATLVLLSIAFWGSKSFLFSIGYTQPLFTNDAGVSYVARVEGKKFFILDAQGQWQESFLAGVNIGLGVPGAFPGEYAIPYETYFQWFTQIAHMGSNVIRVYTPQIPGFYQALYDYNRAAATPLYLLQGIYMDEGDVLRYGDVFAPESVAIADMRRDIVDCVNMLHGNAVIGERAGKASGIYRYDVSKYVIGWILGIECEAYLVDGTNKAHPAMTSFQGDYVYADDVSPFEVFIAQMQELAIAYETETYHMQRPVAFSNWATTDPLRHANEPRKAEDLVAIDVEKIKAKETFAPGFYASYHVYPYYPDFMNYPSGSMQTDANPYLAYLRSLVSYHAMPVLISEFGLPASRGVTHINRLSGLNQGGHSEEQQGKGLVSMLEDIHRSGCMGGVVFAWQDEWFKMSWNTMDFDDKEARPKWLNVESSEVNFGLNSFKAFPSIQIDGQGNDWRGTAFLGEDKRLRANWDASFLYLWVGIDDFADQKYIIPIDTIFAQGSTHSQDGAFERAADFVLVLEGKSDSRLLVDPYYNPNYKLYGTEIFSPEVLSAFDAKGSGEFRLVQQVISGKLNMPSTGQVVPAQFWDTGKLMYGISNPDSDLFDSRADIFEGDRFVELRIPWMLLNFADPSSGKILDDLHSGDKFALKTISEVYVGLGKAGDSKAISMNPYQLPNWGRVDYTMRHRRSYDMLSAAFPRYATYPISADAQMQEALRLRDTRLLYLRFERLLSHIDLVVILLLLSALLVIYLFLLLLVVNIHLNHVARRRQREWNHLRDIMWLDEEDSRRQLHVKYMCTPKGLDMLGQFLADECPWESGAPLLKVIRSGRYEQCMQRFMRSKDLTFIILVIRIAGQLRLRYFRERIMLLMGENKDNLELQYAGFLALSLMGFRTSLVLLCEQLDYTKGLSFRSLKEIFAAYSGDKPSLYRDLLNSPDPYIRRIAVKNIGDDGIKKLANRLLPLLDTQDANLQYDLFRTFGQLCFAPAGNTIAQALDSPNWTLRNAAVMALASIDVHKYLPQITKGLKDKEWWVRYNSARELCLRIPSQTLLQIIPGLDDRYAAEILQFVIDEKKLMHDGEAER